MTCLDKCPSPIKDFHDHSIPPLAQRCLPGPELKDLWKVGILGKEYCFLSDVVFVFKYPEMNFYPQLSRSLMSYYLPLAVAIGHKQDELGTHTVLEINDGW